MRCVRGNQENVPQHGLRDRQHRFLLASHAVGVKATGCRCAGDTRMAGRQPAEWPRSSLHRPWSLGREVLASKVPVAYRTDKVPPRLPAVAQGFAADRWRDRAAQEAVVWPYECEDTR